MFNETNYIDSVNHAFTFIVVIAAALLLLITFVMLYFVYKYNAKRNKKAVNIEGNLGLEITWTVIPLILVSGMFWYGYLGYEALANPPANAYKIKVIGQMWKWNFEYNNGEIKADTLYVPAGKPIQLDITSMDVNHSFYMPHFRFKKDALPTKNNMVWFQSDETGIWDIACAEYCGLNHWNMYNKVHVVPQAEFDEWLAAKKGTSPSTITTPAVVDTAKNAVKDSVITQPKKDAIKK
jgi:cytochrome c oxidase subunit 2